MLRKGMVYGTVARAVLLLAVIAGGLAMAASTTVSAIETEMGDMTPTGQPHQFQRIEQPLSNKIAVTLVGVGLIGLELWWFLFSKPKARSVSSTTSPESNYSN
jgi:plastocyanin domain-containing protein